MFLEVSGARILLSLSQSKDHLWNLMVIHIEKQRENILIFNFTWDTVLITQPPIFKQISNPWCISKLRGGSGDVCQVYGTRVAAPRHLHAPFLSFLRGQGRPGVRTKLMRKCVFCCECQILKLFPGVRESCHLQAGQTPDWRRQRSWSVLHPALCRHL